MRRRVPSPEADGLHRTTLADGQSAIVKRRHSVPQDFFAAEAHGLAALREVQALRVPEVFEASTDYIVLEDLGGGERAAGCWQRAGAGLARQHAVVGARFGFDHAGFCGDSPQDNTPDGDGWRFFAERRLLPQMRRARDHGLLDQGDAESIEALCVHLRDRVPEMPAVLLHGDLWSGNLHVCGDGSPALIDAGAVHYGWAEADLAMLTLFGSPPDAFFQAYVERAPSRQNWHERVPLYNLYHLLNHVNLFGAGYLGSLWSALAACQ